MSYVTTRTLRGLGDVCTVLANGSRVCGSQPAVQSRMSVGARFRTAMPVRSPTQAIIADGGTATGTALQPPPRRRRNYYGGGYGGQYGGGQGSQYGTQPQNQLTTAQLEQLLQTNPGALTQQQYQQLQQQGFVANTLPYSSASQIATPSSAGIDPSTGQPYGTATAAPTTGTDLSSIPVWVWGVIGLLVLMFVMRQK